jgi:uncharacterized protein YlxW (UPF0749 family)
VDDPNRIDIFLRRCYQAQQPPQLRQQQQQQQHSSKTLDARVSSARRSNMRAVAAMAERDALPLLCAASACVTRIMSASYVLN